MMRFPTLRNPEARGDARGLGRGRLFASAAQRRLAERPTPSRVLVAGDPQSADHRQLVDLLAVDGYQVTRCTHGGLAGALRAGDVDLIIVDQGDASRFKLETLVDSVHWAVPIIVLANGADASVRRMGSALVFAKPFEAYDLRMATLHVLGRR